MFRIRLEVTENKNRRAWIWTLTAYIILLGCEFFFLRNVILTDAMFGDNWDGRLTMLFTEHWYHFFRGDSSLTDMGFFYPAANTLAYSDMFLAHGLIHSFLRFLGIDIYDAFKLTLILIHLIGTVGTFILLKKELDVDYWWALIGTITFSFTSTYSIHVAHTQLLAVSLVPVLAVFVVRFFRFFDNRKKRRRNAITAILLFALLLYTAWYIFFFTVLFICTGLLVWLCRDWIHRSKDDKRKDLKQVRVLLPEILAYIIILALLMIPFAILELPVLKMSGGRSYGEVWGALPEAIDLINVSNENWLMGPLLRAMKLGERGYTFEVIEGFSIALLVIFLFSWIMLHYKRSKLISAFGRTPIQITEIGAITVAVSCLLMLRLSSNGVSFWWFVYNVFPGATSIRAVARYLLYLSLPLSIITALMGNYVSYGIRKHGKRYALLMTALVVFAFCSNIHIGGVFARWTEEENRAFIDNVPEPPEDCESFYLSKVIEGQSGPYYQLDAYQIADKFKIHTIHGYSGLNPPGWGNMWDVNGQFYGKAVSGWIQGNRLSNVYSYDEVNREWKKYDSEDVVDSVFDASANLIPDHISGVWDLKPDGEFSWTEKQSVVILKNADISRCGLKVKLGMVREKYLMQNQKIDPECKLYVNSEFVAEIPVLDGVKEYTFPIEPADDDLYEIKLDTNCFFIPSDLGENGDGRELSLQLYYLGSGEQ